MIFCTQRATDESASPETTMDEGFDLATRTHSGRRRLRGVFTAGTETSTRSERRRRRVPDSVSGMPAVHRIALVFRW